MLDQLKFDKDVQYMLNDLKALDDIGVLKRCNSDVKRPNNYGFRVIELCKSHGLSILNGRLGSDINGKATTTDNSVIDYVLSSHFILSRIHSYIIHDFDALFSDKHCRITWSLKCNNNLRETSRHVCERRNFFRTHRSMWKTEKIPEFLNNIENEAVTSIVPDLQNDDIPIDDIVVKFKDLYINAANATFGDEKEIELQVTNDNMKVKFSRDTRNKKAAYYRAKRLNK